MCRFRWFPGSKTVRRWPDRRRVAMSKLKIKDGTPVGSEHLCRSCSNGQFTTGYRESDVLVICTNSNPARLVPFPVCECTDYWDRNRPSYGEMARLALNLSEGRRKPVRGFSQTGFASSAENSQAAPGEVEEPKVEQENEPAFAD
jgi:hypothetical protein